MMISRHRLPSRRMMQMTKDKAMNAETPVYVFDKDKFQKNIDAINHAFGIRYPNFRIGYSYKTNYASAVCRLANKLGCYAEVVSPMEYAHALKLGVNHEDIIYNGVIKDIDGKVEVAMYGGIVNVDNIDELIELNDRFAKIGCNARVGVRLNFDIGNGVVSRFGFDVGGEDYERMKLLFKYSSCMTLVGVHCHISKARELPFWEKRVEGVIKVVNDLIYSGCIKDLEYIDLGSNLYGSMEPCLAEQFGEYIPTFSDYADVICKPLYKAFRDRLPQLILEPGTPAVANAMGVLASVVGMKTVQGKTFLLMDCSKFNLGAIAGVKNVPIKVYRFSKGEHVENADMVGYTCIEDDVVYLGFTGGIGIGDKVLFKNVGAYSNTFSPQFIMPTIGMVEDNGKTLKRRDAYKDVFGRYQ